MNLTQISLGIALLVVSSLAFLGLFVFESHVPVYALTAIALVVTVGVLLLDTADSDRLSK